MSKIRLVFVGTGAMGQCAHLANYATMPECEVVALAELRPRLGEAVARRYGIPAVYGDAREMLEKERYDGIVHINHFGMHGQTVPMLAAFGKPILTEKPLANSVETGQAIIASLATRSVRHYLAYHKRCDPAVAYAKRLMAAWSAGGEMGTLRYVRITMPPGDWIANGFAQRLKTDEPVPAAQQDARPAGMDADAFAHFVYLVNYYIHQVNLLRHFIGDYEVTYADRSGMLLVARSAGGVTATIEMGTHTTSVAWQESVFVAYERGTIGIELPAPLAVNRSGRVVVYRDPKGGTPERLEPQLPWVHAMRAQAESFVRAVRGEATDLATAEDGLKDLVCMRDYMGLFVEAGGKLTNA